MAPVSHLVLIKLPNITSENYTEFYTDLINLTTGCKKPDGSNYIVSLRGGPNNYPEGHNLCRGYTHAFVIEFASKEDRDYYNKSDPFHLEYLPKFFATAGGLENILVLDFEYAA